MTPEQVRLVQQTFADVVPVADKAAEIFYGRLFEKPHVFQVHKKSVLNSGSFQFGELTRERLGSGCSRLGVAEGVELGSNILHEG